MQAAKTKRSAAKGVFIRSGMKTTVTTSDCSMKTVERRFEEMRSRWSDVQEVHEEYISHLQGEQSEAAETSISELCNTFCSMEAMVDDYIDKRTLERNRPIELPTKTERRARNHIQLERLKLKQFTGDIRKYPRFKSEFCNHIRPVCNPEQVAFILKSYLSETVREDVENIDEDCDAVWDRLDKKYGNQGRLIDTILSDVKHIPHCSEDDRATLQMIKIVERAHNDLKMIGEESEMNNSTIVSIIEERMPEEMAKEWIKMVTSEVNVHENKFKHLMRLMNQWRDRIEYKLGNIRNVGEVVGETYYGQGTVTPYGTKRQTCWLHQQDNGDHPIWRCKIFRNKPVEERIELVKTNKACYSCLEVSHTSSNCTRGFKCRERGCNQSHHQLLHEVSERGLSLHTEEFIPRENNVTKILPIQSLTAGKRS